MYKGMDCLQVVWKDLDTRQRVVIGTLCRDEEYTFKYNKETLSHASKLGFKGLVAFQDMSKVYTSKNLFPAFATRLPDRRRSDIKKILEKYDLEEYDAFELLKRTEGRLPIDTLEFIEAIDLDCLEEGVKIRKEFFVAGVRHCEVCHDRNDDDCTLNISINSGDKLELVLEEDNKFDRNAVALYKDNKKVGFIPNYYSKSIHDAVVNKFEIECTVKEFNAHTNCQECLKTTLSLSR